MLGQLRTTTCFRNQHTAGSETGVLINVRMSISWNQAVSKGDLQNATKILAWAQLVGFSHWNPELVSTGAAGAAATFRELGYDSFFAYLSIHKYTPA